MAHRPTSQAQLDAKLLRFAATGNATGISFALHYGANRQALDAQHRTAAELAAAHGFAQVADWLVSIGVPSSARLPDHVLAFQTF